MGTAYDIAAFLYAWVAIFFGFNRGIAREGMRLAVILIATLASWLLRTPAQWILVNGCGVNELFATLLAFPATFLTVDCLGSIVTGVIEKACDWDKPTMDRRLQGAVFGLIRGVLGLFIVSALFAACPLPGDPLGQSRLVAAMRSSGLGSNLVMTGPYAKPVAALARLNQAPEKMIAFARSPEIQAIAKSPEVEAVLRDTEVRKLLERRDPVALVRNPKMAALLADPRFQERIRRLDIEAIEARISGGEGTKSPRQP